MKARKTIKYPSARISEPSVLKDAPAVGSGRAVNVREAKAHLSALLDWVAAGNEVTITSDGVPKAKLIRPETPKSRKIFQGMGDYLTKQPMHRRLTADAAVNQDRDARGW